MTSLGPRNKCSVFGDMFYLQRAKLNDPDKLNRMQKRCGDVAIVQTQCTVLVLVLRFRGEKEKTREGGIIPLPRPEEGEAQ